MWHKGSAETIEAYALGTIGALTGAFQYFIKDKIMELRLNHQSIETDNLSEQARQVLARTIAFNRDTAIGQLAVLGLPEDHPYEPQTVEQSEGSPAGNQQLSLDNHRGFGLGH